MKKEHKEKFRKQLYELENSKNAFLKVEKNENVRNEVIKAFSKKEQRLEKQIKII